MSAVMIVALIGSLCVTGVFASHPPLVPATAEPKVGRGKVIISSHTNGNNNDDCRLSNSWSDQDYVNEAPWHPGKIATLIAEVQDHFCAAPNDNGAVLPPDSYSQLARLVFDAYHIMILLVITGQSGFADFLARLDHQNHNDTQAGSILLSVAHRYECAALQNFIASWQILEIQTTIQMAFGNLEPSLADPPLRISLQMLLLLVIRKRHHPGYLQPPEEAANFMHILGEACAAAELAPSRIFAIEKWLLSTWLVLFDRGNFWAEPEALVRAMTAHFLEHLLAELPTAEGRLLQELLGGEDGQIDHTKALKHLVFALHCSVNDRQEEEQAVKALGDDNYRGRALREKIRSLRDWLDGEAFIRHVTRAQREVRLRGLLLRQMQGVIFEDHLDPSDFALPYLQRIGGLLQELVEEFHGSPLLDQHAEMLQYCLAIYDASLEAAVRLWEELRDLRPPQGPQIFTHYVVFSPHALLARAKNARSRCTADPDGSGAS